MSKTTPTPTAVRSTTPIQTEPPKAAITPQVATKPAITKAAINKPVTATKVSKVATKKVVKATTEIAKPVKVEKTPKLKMERDSFTMPKVEYTQFAVLKERLTKLGQPAKKSELLRAGIMQLSAMTDAALKAAMTKVPAIKTGRPNNK